MSASTLYRLSGLALMAALPLVVVGLAIHPPGEQIVYLLNPTYPWAHALFLVGAVLALLAMPAMYARQAPRAGWIGLAGFVLTMLFLVLACDLLLWEWNGAPRLAANPATQYLVAPGNSPTSPGGLLANGALGVVGRFFVLGVANIIGPILLGIATWRAGVLPRWAGILQIAAWPLLIVWGGAFTLLGKLGVSSPDVLLSPLGLGYTVQFLAYAWAGFALWSEARSRRPIATLAPDPVKV